MSVRNYISVLSLLSCLWPLPGAAQEPEPVVHAVLFYSPTCPHCHEVITNYLIPLQNEYGRKLVILGMDTSQGWANEIFWAALRHYEVPEEKWAVPFMVVDDQILVGGNEIPGHFSDILEEGLASGGIDLPDLPELMDFMSEQGLLDQRYPNRRIALQAPQEPTPNQGAAAGTEEVEPGAGPDSVSAVSPDSVQGAGIGAGDEAPTGRDTLAGSDAAAPDSLPGTDTPEALPDSAAAAGPDSPPSAVEGTGEGERSTATPPSETTAPSQPSRVPEPGSGGREGSGAGLGLGDAATRLESMTMWDRFNQDPAGNSLSVLVLLGMATSLVFTGLPQRTRRGPWPLWVIPVLVVLGAGVASYLSFVEVTQVEAVCGPVGDCNTVNQSEYATLFGVLPVGILGLLGYALILLLWGLGTWGAKSVRAPATLGLWGAALFGVLFSIYLTFLEPFVIGATCAWCLSSAVIMTLLLWATAPLAAGVWPGREEDRAEIQA